MCARSRSCVWHVLDFQRYKKTQNHNKKHEEKITNEFSNKHLRNLSSLKIATFAALNFTNKIVTTHKYGFNKSQKERPTAPMV